MPRTDRGWIETVRIGEIHRHEQDIDLIETSSGGGSDGNFTSAAGIPTLDGLGAIGNEWHSPNEYVVVSALPRRAELLRRMITDLGS